MASLITNGTVFDISHIEPIRNNSSVHFSNEYLFYSNSPETFDSSALADYGKWLFKGDVEGSGQVYTWHVNKTGRRITSCLLIYNPNSFEITVTSTNRGLTNNSGEPDTEAWKSYFLGSRSESITIAPYGYGTLFQQSVANGRVFGIVARTNVTRRGSSTPAKAVFYDLAYDTNSGGANSYAIAQSSHQRGVGNSFYTTFYFNELNITSSGPQAYSIGSGDDTFYGEDMVTIVDENRVPNPLLGNFGQQLEVNLPIKNSTGSSGTFYVFLGSRGGVCNPIVSLDGSVHYKNWVGNEDYMRAVDMINVGYLANGQATTVRFHTAVSGMSNTPYVIGVRKL
ncbi:hypothetical protein Curi_c00440 [Gottschalkia acidurici 9a]|uniref:Uncharacterized protein n=1 Tax=Gottschalkia acidurici (strain ATCC 7906 / DSM 604 / BCRC 14475 / CIP 104303 / KCTC 5404 / NCIMB 10678 / 9a) TaxID=1128398 RepID=K0AXF2_GOTA9|nr:hypothetical protein [Gottschalkia acidurici]AFS77126.1 hypothetical protein Curi_c00440 [Gottschalkia acidurici 9a]